VETEQPPLQPVAVLGLVLPAGQALQKAAPPNEEASYLPTGQAMQPLAAVAASEPLAPV